MINMNIVYLTSEYKDFSLREKDTFTYISNSFAREWVKLGHKVITIHNASHFPRIIYYLPNKIKNIFEKYAGFTWGSYESIRYKAYDDQGVLVYRLPIRKFIPHKSPFHFIIKSQAKKIEDILEYNQFKPDVIIGQWISPQMELINELKKVYDCKTSVVLHGNGYYDDNDYHVEKYLSSIDNLGVRSDSEAKKVQDILNLPQKPFVCYSGIPNDFITSYDIKLEKFNNNSTWNITYVGRLIKLKNVDTIIRACSKLENKNWRLNIVGDGDLYHGLKKLCKSLNVDNNVKFYGKISRKEVMEVLEQTHIFTMVSENEVFGLVYLEAMGASCVTIGSKNEGIDGVITDGENGYLIESGNVEELERVFEQIMNKEKSELEKLLKMSYSTAFDFSDSKVAIDYLNKATR